jgi:NAD+ diphosphatase
LPPEPFFSGPGLDRADFARSDPEKHRQFAESPLARELVWTGDLPAIAADGSLQWQAVKKPELFLGLDGGSPRFCALQQEIASGPAVFSIIASLNRNDAPIFAAALSLARWHLRHRFCANCGSSTDVVRGGWSRRCGSCEAEHYPRVDPVVIMLAEHEGKLLLGRQHHYPPGRYSALAGFLEAGETIEEAVARELKEEAGIDVADVTYIASQPWPFPSSLMVGCTSRALSAALTIDQTELDDARWFSREEVAAAIAGEPNAPFQAPPPHAIARTLLEHWLAS